MTSSHFWKHYRTARLRSIVKEAAMTLHVLQSDPGWLVVLSLSLLWVYRQTNLITTMMTRMKKMTVRKKKSQELSESQTKLCRFWPKADIRVALGNVRFWG